MKQTNWKTEFTSERISQAMVETTNHDRLVVNVGDRVWFPLYARYGTVTEIGFGTEHGMIGEAILGSVTWERELADGQTVSVVALRHGRRN